MKYIYYFFILTFSFSLAACSPQPNKEVPVEFQKGQKIFHKVCSNCHGADALGKTTTAPRLINEDFINPDFPDADIRAAIINGTEKMPSQKTKVSEDEIIEIIKYLRYSQEAAGIVAEEEDENEWTVPEG